MNVNNLFDADAYWRAGKFPWTIFAFPARLADAQRLPCDGDAKRLLAELQGRGLPVGIWAHPDIKDTIYFACPDEAREQVHAAVRELEELGKFEADFCTRHTEYLFSIGHAPRA